MVGSIKMFGDDYVNKESNAKLGEAIVKLLLMRKEIRLTLFH